MSQLPLKLENYIICLFNLEYGGIQNGQFYTWIYLLWYLNFFLYYKWLFLKIERPICTFDGIYGVTMCYPSRHIWYKSDFPTLLLDDILNFAWFSHRQALNMKTWQLDLFIVGLFQFIIVCHVSIICT